MRPLHALAALTLVAAPLAAAETCTQVALSPQAPNWTRPVLVERFDPLLGTLTGVRIELAGSVDGLARIEQLTTSGASYTLQFQAFFELRRPDATALVSTQPSQGHVVDLTGFDGVLDFAGTSGRTLPSSAATTPPETVLLSDPADLALFTGATGSAGTLTLGASAFGASTATGPGNPATSFEMQAGADVRVCYEFTPRIQPFCSGDGSAAACPCGNQAPAGSQGGCLNSLGLSALLAGDGDPSLSGDTFVLQASALPQTASALYFQGTSATNGGTGSAFGDGLRCAGGSVVRLGTRISVGGASSCPSPGGASISQVGGISSPGVRTYQVWYRNSAGFCTPAAFNLTNGVSVSWRP